MTLSESIWQPSSPIFLPTLTHHQKTLAPYFTQWLRSQQMPPVLLLTGPAGIGKQAVARRLGHLLLNVGNTLKPCLDDPQPSSSGSLDYLLTEISPSEGNDAEGAPTHSKSDTLKIDQFRKLKEKMGFGRGAKIADGSSPLAAARVILIPHAEKMTLQASNSILKMLEEPPTGWVFILTANDATLLLPTVVSRCQKIRLTPLPEQTLVQILTQLTPDATRAQVCAKLAVGSVERGVLFLEEDIWEKRKVIFEFLKRPTAHLKELMDWTTTESNSTERIEIFMDLLEQILFEQISLHQNSTSKPLYSFWIQQSQKLCEAREKLRTPVNRKLLVQDLLMPWLGAPA